jgi:hypothetical protein
VVAAEEVLKAVAAAVEVVVVEGVNKVAAWIE